MSPGDRVKIKSSDPARTITGTVQAILADRIDLVEGASVKRSSIRRIHLSEGMGTCATRGAKIGTFTGFVYGALVASQAKTCVGDCYSNEPFGEEHCRDVCSGPGAGPFVVGVGITAAAGAGLGALIGRSIKRERWTEVQLSITAWPAPMHGKFSPAITLTWIW